MRASVLLLLFSGCAADPPPLTDFPDPSTFDEQTALPDLFLSATSSDRATTATAFAAWRKPQLRALFSHYAYGFTPEPVSVRATRTATLDDVVPGAVWEEYDLSLGDVADATLHLALIRPTNVTAPPVILGLNKCGNHSLVDDPRVRLSTSFVIPACGTDAASTRGVQKALWPLEHVVSRGWAVATFHESDAAPDDAARFADGLRAKFRPQGAPKTAWATLAVWAWALRHAAAWLAEDTLRQAQGERRIAAFGHSRRGKAALLAGAFSQDIDAVVAHQSGTGGAALNRSLEGETIALITSAFPHWFNGIYPEFSNAELKTPVDQHELIALVAPRRVVLVDGDDDAWADPQGSRKAAEAAAPAWELYGSKDVPTWTSRPGGHDVFSSDWDIFLDQLER